MSQRKRLITVWSSSLGREINIKGYFAKEEGIIEDHYGKVVKIYQDGTVRLQTHDAGWQRIPAHRLIALAFVLNPNNWSFIKFLDNNKNNREASNLVWVSNKKDDRKSKQPYGNKKEIILKGFAKGMRVKQLADMAECSKMYAYKVLASNGLYYD